MHLKENSEEVLNDLWERLLPGGDILWKKNEIQQEKFQELPYEAAVFPFTLLQPFGPMDSFCSLSK
jgi:hypothetical protein